MPAKRKKAAKKKSAKKKKHSRISALHGSETFRSQNPNVNPGGELISPPGFFLREGCSCRCPQRQSLKRAAVSDGGSYNRPTKPNSFSLCTSTLFVRANPP